MPYTDVLGLNTVRLAAIIGRLITIDFTRANVDGSVKHTSVNLLSAGHHQRARRDRMAPAVSRFFLATRRHCG
jgi:hypothetical protein